MLEIFICNTFAREPTITSTYGKEYRIFDQMMVILHILIDILLHFIRYRLQFYIITKECGKIDGLWYKLAFAIGNTLLGIHLQ